MPDDKSTPAVNTKLKSDWNHFLSTLDKKGIRGKPDLDKWGLGYKVFDDYVKSNPGTSLSRQSLPQIRKEILSYRQWVLDEQKKPLGQRQAQLGEGVNESNFMRHVLENEKTKDPNYTGQHLTSTAFPESYLRTLDANKKLIKTENLGFATIKK